MSPLPIRPAASRLLAWTLLVGAAAPGVRAAPCPAAESASSLPASYRYQESGRTRQAVASLELPVPVAEAAALVRELEEWPRWLFLAADGSPNLSELRHDAASGRAAARLRDEGGELVARTSFTETAGGLAVRLDFQELEQIKSLDAELEVGPARCEGEGWSRVSARIGWSFGWAARMFGGETEKLLPAILVLALRDDFAAEAVSRRPELAARFARPLNASVALEAGEDGTWRAVATGEEPPPREEGRPERNEEQLRALREVTLQPGDELVRLVPRVLRLAPAGMKQLAAAAAKPDEKLVGRVLRALAHEHAYVAGAPLVRRGGELRTLQALRRAEDEVAVNVTFTGSSLQFGVAVYGR